MEPEKIDSHTHILPDPFRHKFSEMIERDRTFGALFGGAANTNTAGAEELIASMDSSGIAKSVTVGYGWTDVATARLSNDYLIESAQTYEGRLVPFCSVNPLWGAGAIEEMKRCRLMGARGVGELHPDSQGLLAVPFDRLAPFMDCAREFGMPILMHTSEPVGHSYPGKGTATPDVMMALVSAFPGNKFIFAHFGGGLPFYALMPEVKQALSNCYFDSAAFPFLYDPMVFELSAKAVGSDRIMFASDFPLIKQSRALSQLEAVSLSQSDRSAVLRDSAANLFQLGI